MPIFVNDFCKIDFLYLRLWFIQPFDPVHLHFIFILLNQFVLNLASSWLFELSFDKTLVLNIPFPLLFRQLQFFSRFDASSHVILLFKREFSLLNRLVLRFWEAAQEIMSDVYFFLLYLFFLLLDSLRYLYWLPFLEIVITFAFIRFEHDSFDYFFSMCLCRLFVTNWLFFLFFAHKSYKSDNDLVQFK